MKKTEKAKEISEYYEHWWSAEAPDVEGASYDSAIEMAEWMIDKAVTWIALNAEMYGSFNHGKLNKMIINFKKAMEE